LQKYDLEAKGDWDIIAKDFGELAARMGVLSESNAVARMSESDIRELFTAPACCFAQAGYACCTSGQKAPGQL
jgi:hypothetical protein